MDVRNFGEAERVLRERPPPDPDDPEYLEIVAALSAARGDRAGVDQRLRQLEVLDRMGRGVSRPHRLSFRRAQLAALLGDRDEAVNWLTRAFREGLRNRNELHWEPSFDRLRGYPPFEALMRPVDDPEDMPPQ